MLQIFLGGVLMYYKSLNKTELENELCKLNSRYNSFKEREISLDMSRGKPGPTQLDVASDIFNEKTNNIIYTQSTKRH